VIGPRASSTARSWPAASRSAVDGKTTKVIDAYGSAFITAVATLDDDIMEVHFDEGGPGSLQRHIVAAITDEDSPRRRR